MIAEKHAWPGAKGRKDYCFPAMNVNYPLIQQLAYGVWITFYDRYRLPVLGCSRTE